MSKGDFIDLFNAKSEEFIKELVVSFPNIKHFAQIKTGFMFIKNLDKRQPQDIFNTYISAKYREQILTCDEKFFLDKDYDMIDPNYKREYWEEFIDNIRTVWQDLDEPNKEAIWRYFKVLVILNDKCVNNT